jgi:tetratricopeptide (TPR) repeat protein/tRNA A-37 threonylcarbamoyl transferase component Bud32
VALHTGARLGPYEIVALLGRGGMGEVYRAIDTRVARTVAIKVLPADAADQPERRQRFEREAKAVARLNHPHICALYDVGQQDGTEFLVMEFLDGETLGARLATGPLPLAEALTHAIALAQALARAHREGITHRDIKPSNVMLTEGGVKLLDFGLAKLRDRSAGAGQAAAAHAYSPLDDLSTGDGLSPEGTLVGTIAYMSPEQLAGGAVDARTDIYALGLIVYEMITGQRAFAKGSQAGLIAAIMTEDPPAMTELRPGTPAAVERIVLTALEKDPNKRWQDAGDFARELAWAGTDSHTTAVNAPAKAAPRASRTWAIGAAVAIVATIGMTGVLLNRVVRSGNPVRNLVVLPCRASDDATAQAYCDGFTDTLSAKLTPLAISRGLQMTSTLDVRQRGVRDAAHARREFGASLVLEGGLLRAAGALRVNYVLVDAATLRQIAAFSETAPSADPFALQDRVATWAAGILAMRLNETERQTLAASGTRVPAALDLYLEGRGYALEFQKPGNVDAAIDRFTRAVALDARFAAAHAGLGGALWLKYESARDADLIPRARAACAEALTLDAVSPSAHVCQGTIALGTGAFEEAAREFQTAVDREPTSDEATLGLARAQARSGALAAADATYKRAIALRPQYWATRIWLGTFYREQGRYAEAAREYEQAILLTPDNARALYVLGGLYFTIGRYDDAIAACRRSVALVPSLPAYANWGSALARLRRFREAADIYERGRRIGPNDYRIDGNLARAYYWSGRPNEAVQMYKGAVDAAIAALRVNPGDIDARISLADYYAKLGDRARALSELGRLPANLADPHVLVFQAVVYADVADGNAALSSLERAAKAGLARNELTDWIELDTLKNDPRFAALTR